MADTRVAILSPYDWEEPNFGGQSRIFQIAKNLGNKGFNVDIYSGENRTELKLPNVSVHFWHELLRVETYYPVTLHDQRRLPRMTLHIIESLRRFSGSDIIICELLNTAWHGMVLSKLLRKPAILDEHNIEWNLRYQLGNESRHDWERVRTFEEICWKEFDHITVASESDQNLIGNGRKIREKVSLVPNGVDTIEFSENSDLRSRVREKHQLRGRTVVLFNGSFGYFPNVDAAKIIIDKIYPATKRTMPNVCFMFLGRDSETLAIPNREDFMLPGIVHDIASYINASDVCVSPLRYGSGTRLKILEWMACGKPVIATRKAAEGIDVVHGENIVLEDDISAYNKWITKLSEDTEFRERIGRNGAELIKRKYDWKRCIIPMIDTIRRLLGDE